MPRWRNDHSSCYDSGNRGAGSAQGPRLRTVLDAKTIQAILNEISGQLAFNNEIMGRIERIRAEGIRRIPRGGYLSAKLREYGLDEVRLETSGRKTRAAAGGRIDAELWMVTLRG